MPNEESNPFCLRRVSCYLYWSDSHPTVFVSKTATSFELGSRAYSHSAQCVSWVGSRAQNERVDHPATALSVNVAKKVWTMAKRTQFAIDRVPKARVRRC
jgi:hypothetical protein